MSIVKSDPIIRDLFLGFVRLHILYHAGEGPVYGLDMIRELTRHGYQLSPGTIYPILHRLEAQGYLVAEKHVVGGKVRKLYRATPSGREVLEAAINRATELLREVRERDPMVA